MLAIVARVGFVSFAVYRIAVGGVVLTLLA